MKQYGLTKGIIRLAMDAKLNIANLKGLIIHKKFIKYNFAASVNKSRFWSFLSQLINYKG